MNLKQTEICRKIFYLIISVCLVWCQIDLVFGQEKNIIQIEATILDETGNPIPDAVIFAREGAIEINTDENGHFSIRTGAEDIILIEADGYHAQRILAKSLISEANIVLLKLPFQMGEDDRINVPFGRLYKRQIPGAVSSVNPEEILLYDSRQNIYGTLNSRVPGLIGNLNNRGLGQCLVFVDGMPRPANNFNLQEVEQITYLRDATSRILYGVLADQGVIMVTTKRGQAGKRKISVSAEYGMNKPIRYPEFLNSYDYVMLYNEASLNDGLAPFYDSAAVEGYRQNANPILYPDQSYYNSTFLRNYQPFASVITEFSGGNELAQYYMNLGWNTTGTLLKVGEGVKERSHRVNIRGNIDFQVTSFMKMNLDVVGIFDIQHGPNGNFWANASNFNPNYYPMLIDTSQVYYPDGYSAASLVKGNKILGGNSQYQQNIYGDLVLGGYYDNLDRIGQINTGIDLDLRNIMEGLTVKTYLSFDIYNFFSTRQNNTYAVYEPRAGGGDTIRITKIGDDNFTGTQNVGDVTYYRYIGYYGVLDYNRIFATDHRLSITGLAYTDRNITNEQIHHDVHLHFGLRANYMLRNKYLLELSGALPGSPKFARGNRFKFAPSIGIGWIASEEDFMRNLTVINYLKLKTSFGLMNTDKSAGDYYLYENNYVQSDNFNYADGNYYNNTLIIQNLGNPGISYAQRKEFNAGFEAFLFNYSLWLEGNYFYSNSFNTILKRNDAYPAYLGGFNAFENYGSFQDQGFEFGINYKRESKKLSTTLGVNIVYTVPKALQIDEPAYEYEYRKQEGKPTDAIFGWISEGLFTDSMDIINHPTQTFGPVQPGDIKYKDLNNDKKIDDNDQKIIGYSSPRFQAGLNLNFKYENFELYAQGIYQTGNDVIYNNSYYWIFGDRKYSELAFNRWTPETASTASYPRLSTKNNSNNFRNSTFWIYNDSYFTLRVIQLTITLPAKWMNQMPVKRMLIYLSGNNLITLSPSKEQRELNIGSPPQFRNYSVGLKAMF